MRALGLDAYLLGELTAVGAPVEMLYALRVLLGTLDEIELKGEKLMQPQSLQTEDRVWAALKGYCKMARAAMGGARTADISAASKAQKEGEVRLATALRFRAEKKRLLSSARQPKPGWPWLPCVTSWALQPISTSDMPCRNS